ncbi:hypothetical protein QJS04_geneDACA007857 [Acorus gramineus]|uniref:Uncharacterized protein n=1 Tax=Acorus gramineus TaxID=55184 RepID=A0AAV9B800_ACOGR|nr:hypothetical protein QJS04_geneDACA007857 [Acorus gramineus]
MIHGTIYEAEGHGGGGGDVLFCVIIAWLSIISWITFAWGGGGQWPRRRHHHGKDGGHHAPLFVGGCDRDCDGKCEFCGTYLS